MKNKPQVNIEQIADELLSGLGSVINQVSEDFINSEDHGLLVLGVKYLSEESEFGEGVQTLIFASGYNDVLAEGLYSVLRDQLANGQAGLFQAIRDVIRALEEDFDIDPDEDIDGHNLGKIIH